jgi:hypothetical protein
MCILIELGSCYATPLVATTGTKHPASSLHHSRLLFVLLCLKTQHLLESGDTPVEGSVDLLSNSGSNGGDVGWELGGDNTKELLSGGLELGEGLADNSTQTVLDESILLADQSIGDLGDIGNESIAGGEDLDGLVERENGNGSEGGSCSIDDLEEIFSLAQDLGTLSGVTGEGRDGGGHGLGRLGDGSQGIDEWLSIALLESWGCNGAAQKHAEGKD